MYLLIGRNVVNQSLRNNRKIKGQILRGKNLNFERFRDKGLWERK
jgi:hypothetical protein